MKYYKAINTKTDETIETPFSDELDEIIEYEGWLWGDYHVIEVFKCKGKKCQSTETSQRYDYHGITTGHFCDDCYENNYPYRKDAYPTIETHGYGDRLEDI